MRQICFRSETLLVFFLIICQVSPLFGQSYQSVYSGKLSKASPKTPWVDFSYIEKDHTTRLVLMHPKGKRSLYLSYYFDDSLHLKKSETELLSLTDAALKYRFINQELESYAWDESEVLRAANNISGQIIIEKGYLNRKWMNNAYSDNNFSSSILKRKGYWRYKFTKKNVVKPTFELPQSLKDAGAEKNGNPGLLSYISEGELIEVTTGPRAVSPDNQKGLFERSGKYAPVSSDLIFLAAQKYSISKRNSSCYFFCRFNPSKFEITTTTPIYFVQDHVLIFYTFLSDHSLAMIFAPEKTPNSVDSLCQQYQYIRINSKGEIINKTTFNSPCNRWDIERVEFIGQNKILFYGQANKDNEPAYYTSGNVSSYNHFQIMLVADSIKVNAVSLEQIKEKQVYQPDMEKPLVYKGKDVKFNNFYMSSNGYFFIVLQEYKNYKYDDLMMLQFDPLIEYKACYSYRFLDKGNEAVKAPAKNFFIPVDDNSFSWLIIENAGSTDQKPLIYPSMAILYPELNNISVFSDFGFQNKERYYLQQNNLFLQSGNSLIFGGLDKKNKKIRLVKFDPARYFIPSE